MRSGSYPRFKYRSWILAIWLFGGCMGQVGNVSEGETPPNDDDSPDAIPDGYQAGDVIPAPMAMRRLTNEEYDRTVEALLGTSPGASQRYRFRPDAVDVQGYDNQVESLGISPVRAPEYRAAAIGLAREVMQSEAQRRAVIGCDLEAGGPTCLESFVRDFGRRAFRRPLDADEVAALMALAAAAPSEAGPYGGATLVLEGMLQAPDFLFRVELGTEATRGTQRVQLTGYELATRLSYLFWGTTPDSALLDRAADGALDTAAGVRTAAEAMLADERARLGVRAFTERWLRLTKFEDIPESEAWDPALAADAAEETLRTVESYAWDPNRDFLDLLTTRQSVLNDRMAEHYGLEDVGPDWEPVQFEADIPRVGLLTQASFLAVTGRGGDLLSPVLRGKYVREMFLCEVVPSPPPGVGDTAGLAPDASIRDRWAPIVDGGNSCSTCHRLMNSVGYGLEQYDSAGRFREEDQNGNALTGAGEFVLDGEAIVFQGAEGLASLLRSRDEVASCVAKQLHRFAHGRRTGERDVGAVAQYVERFSKDAHSFRSLLLAVVESDTFRFGIPE